MPYLMGIDLGTSSLKVLIIDEGGNNIALSSRNYQLDAPQTGYAEQRPETWWKACTEAIGEAIQKSGLKNSDIAGISFSGQMHGTVTLDEFGEPIRPAILHCDARSGAQVASINDTLGAERIRSLVRNPIYTGFLLASLLWVRENEPENFRRIRKVCLPKDYLKFKLCGEVSSDWSDATATLAFDMENNCWSREILGCFDLPVEIFPPCFDTFAPVGRVTREAAVQTGLAEGTVIAAGGGDQVMQGVGNGAIDFDTATANIGSSGQVCFQSPKPVVHPRLCTNTFGGYKKDRWIVMGAMMHAGMALKWFKAVAGFENYEQIDREVQRVKPGSGGVIFLPYLNGERTPHINSELSASFIGCNTRTGRAEMARAVMEGVAYAMMQCIEVCGETGLAAKRIIASGGGARSEPWLHIQSDVYGLPLQVSVNEEQACLGAAIAAGVGCGVYKSIEQGCAEAVKYKAEIILPNMQNHGVYQEYYALFKDSYSAGREIFERATRLGRRYS